MPNLPFGKQGIFLTMLLGGLITIAVIGLLSFNLFPWNTIYSSWPWNLFATP
jgi:hypothetical protein